MSSLERLFALALSLLTSTTAVAGDWPTWRGPAYDRVSNETGLVDDWDPKGGPGSNVLWKKPYLAGRSTPIVLGDKLYTLVRDRPGTELEGEKVVCADAATGEKLWEHRFNVYLSDVPDTRVGWSSVVGDPETGRVYAQGVCGYFCCLEGESGDVVWERSLHEELGLLSTYGGRTNFPIVHEDSIITSAVVIGWGDSPKWGLLAKPAHRFLGFDKATGELRWLSGTRLIPYDTTYSTPALVTLAGQRALVFGSGDGAVWAMQAGAGKPIWKAQLSRRGLNVSPAVDAEGRVYTGHSEENLFGNTMGAFVSIDGERVAGPKPIDVSDDLRWANYQAMVGKSSPVVVDGRVYAVTDSGKLLIYDAETGEQLDRKTLGRVMRGSPLYADGKLYAVTRGGGWNVVRRVVEKSESGEPTERFDYVNQDRRLLRGQQVDASPIAAHGRLYVTTSEAMYCLGSADVGPIDVESKETPTPGKPDDRRPAQALLVPYDTLLSPGEEQPFRVRLYNATGDYLRDADPAKVAFGVAGPGKVDNAGVYRAPADASHETALVLAEAAGLSVESRVRIVPELPWRFDFEDGKKAPLTWVGGRIRYVPRAGENGERYLAKPTELPTRPGKPPTKLGTRSRMWMGPHTLSNYTIQADIQLQEGLAGESAAPGPDDPEPELPAAPGAVKLPTAGLINSRYTFALFGPSGEARLYSWCTHDKRTQAVVEMDLSAGVWYRMKLSVVPQPELDNALVQAKVWPRGEAEPGEWTLEFTDEAPNLQGSPGLFGDAKEAEFYLDNITVTPND